MLDPASSVWVYRYDRPDRPGKWSNTSPANTSGGNSPHGDPISAETPQPRYAHQVVYDRRSKIAYMHGGTSGVVTNVARTPSEWTGDWPVQALEGLCAVTEVRLDDFWKLRLERYVDHTLRRQFLSQSLVGRPYRIFYVVAYLNYGVNSEWLRCLFDRTVLSPSAPISFKKASASYARMHRL